MTVHVLANAGLISGSVPHTALVGSLRPAPFGAPAREEANSFVWIGHFANMHKENG
ncbi:hypothetical protein GCM10022226_56660 [Sphaerisporangium flaviroseum]|uniref:Uncharacterized protein n=1 Tax=Sphaerisporangium flaviroseum TaxID=509199 RepID=A0ABP7IX90_9ACTN